MSAFWLREVTLQSNDARKGDQDYGAKGASRGQIKAENAAKAAAKKAEGQRRAKRKAEAKGGGAASVKDSEGRARGTGDKGGQFVSQGDTGEPVEAVQDKLHQPVTGNYDTNTAAAVIAFQKRHNLVADGIVGRQTALALNGEFSRARKVGPGKLGPTTAPMVGKSAAPPESPRKAKPAAVRRGRKGRGARIAGGNVLERLQEDADFEAKHPRGWGGLFAKAGAPQGPKALPGGPKGGTPSGTPMSVIPTYDPKPLKFGKAAGGSNGARFATHQDGSKWLVKQYGGNQDRIASELLANAVYRQMGAAAPRAGRIRLHNGKDAISYPLVDGKPEEGVFSRNGPSEAVGKHFMTDALLANWDFAGLTDDNILWDGAGQPIRVDQGGTFEYRAQGEKKPFGPVPLEVVSLLAPGGQARRASAITPDGMRTQARTIAETMTPGVVDQLVNSARFADKGMRERVRTNLKARIDWMRRFGNGEVGLPGQGLQEAEIDYSLWRLEEALSLKKAWKEALHPRDQHGQFIKAVGGLSAGEQIKLDDRTRVKRDADGSLRVVRNNSIFSGYTSEADAVRDLFDKSAKSSDADSIGGSQSFADYNAYLKSKGIDPDEAVKFGGADVTKGDLVKEIARLDGAIAKAEKGSKYEKRTVKTLKARRAEANKKAASAPLGKPGDSGQAVTPGEAFTPNAGGATYEATKALGIGKTLTHPNGDALHQADGSFVVTIDGKSKKYTGPAGAANALKKGEHTGGVDVPTPTKTSLSTPVVGPLPEKVTPVGKPSDASPLGSKPNPSFTTKNGASIKAGDEIQMGVLDDTKVLVKNVGNVNTGKNPAHDIGLQVEGSTKVYGAISSTLKPHKVNGVKVSQAAPAASAPEGPKKVALTNVGSVQSGDVLEVGDVVKSGNGSATVQSFGPSGQAVLKNEKGEKLSIAASTPFFANMTVEKGVGNTKGVNATTLGVDTGPTITKTASATPGAVELNGVKDLAGKTAKDVLEVGDDWNGWKVTQTFPDGTTMVKSKQGKEVELVPATPLDTVGTTITKGPGNTKGVAPAGGASGAPAKPQAVGVTTSDVTAEIGNLQPGGPPLEYASGVKVWKYPSGNHSVKAPNGSESTGLSQDQAGLLAAQTIQQSIASQNIATPTAGAKAGDAAKLSNVAVGDKLVDSSGKGYTVAMKNQQGTLVKLKAENGTETTWIPNAGLTTMGAKHTATKGPSTGGSGPAKASPGDPVTVSNVNIGDKVTTPLGGKLTATAVSGSTVSFKNELTGNETGPMSGASLSNLKHAEATAPSSGTAPSTLKVGDKVTGANVAVGMKFAGASGIEHVVSKVDGVDVHTVHPDTGEKKGVFKKGDLLTMGATFKGAPGVPGGGGAAAPGGAPGKIIGGVADLGNMAPGDKVELNTGATAEVLAVSAKEVKLKLNVSGATVDWDAKDLTITEPKFASFGPQAKPAYTGKPIKKAQSTDGLMPKPDGALYAPKAKVKDLDLAVGDTIQKGKGTHKLTITDMSPTGSLIVTNAAGKKKIVSQYTPIETVVKADGTPVALKNGAGPSAVSAGAASVKTMGPTEITAALKTGDPSAPNLDALPDGAVIKTLDGKLAIMAPTETAYQGYTKALLIDGSGASVEVPNGKKPSAYSTDPTVMAAAKATLGKDKLAKPGDAVKVAANGGGGSATTKGPPPKFANAVQNGSSLTSYMSQYKKKGGGTTSSQDDVISTYVGNSIGINDAYRNPSTKKTPSEVSWIKKGRDLEDAFDAQAPLDQPIVLVRKTTNDEWVDAKVGEGIEDKGFLSTTSEMNNISSGGVLSSSKNDKGNAKIELHILVPAGRKVLALGSASLGTEREVLLNRGQTYEVLKEEMKGSTKVLYVEMI